MNAIRLRTEHMQNPMGLDIAQPFLSWVCAGGTMQTAFEIIATQNGKPVWETGKVDTNAMHVVFGKKATSRAAIAWRVRLWDETGTVGEWSEAATFEMGLLGQGHWQAKWINPEPKTVETKDKKALKPQRAASYLKKTFLADTCENGRLYITCHGIYAAYLNGQRVGDFVLAPGPGTYNKKLCYQTYNVSALLHEGENELVVALGDGWYRGYSGVGGDFDLFGSDIALLCQLEAGGKTLCVSDESWQASQSGPVRDNDMHQGELYDARMEKITHWHPVRLEAFGTENLACSNSVPVLENEAFSGKIIQTPGGETVVDFGQNLAGYIELFATAKAGQRITLTCGETLDENGNFTNANFQPGSRHKAGAIHQKIDCICKDGENHYKPFFTIMGFQYAKLETDVPLENLSFTAHAVYSQMEELATFTSSNADLDQLVHNSSWSQKSNFCDVPTDCPTRERAGWTGDAGVFVNTGLTLMDSLPVFRKWLGECRITQKADGKVYNIAPPNKQMSFMTEMLSTSVGWGDASILVPYALYKRTGDVRLLKENYGMMQKWYKFLENRAKKTKLKNIFAKNPYKKYTIETGMDYGEWCEPGMDARTAMANPKKSVGTAYLAQSGKLMAEIAAILGKETDAAHYAEVAKKARQAYRFSFTNNGKIESDRQCEYVRALKFGLLSQQESEQAAADLNELIIKNDYHLNTGFLSTPYLCEMLVQYGYLESAYRLLLQDTQPSWLYAVKQGANTIWETWDGIDENGKPRESLNHYSYGVISGWLIEGICGIHVENATLTIRPTPFEALGFAKASYQSPLGKIESGWRYEGENVVYEFTIPANVVANVILPNGKNMQLTAGKYIV